MQHNAAFHQSLHSLPRLKQPSGTEILDNLENSTCDPLKYTMGYPKLIGIIHQNTKGSFLSKTKSMKFSFTFSGK